MNPDSANHPGFKAWKLVLKLFLPSWNFFNDFGLVTRLEFCPAPAGSGASVWQPVHPEVTTSDWTRVFFSVRGNRELLEKSLIDRVATALQDQPAPVDASFGQSASGLILARIVRARLRTSDLAAVQAFRFRLVTVDAANHCETLFESAVLPVMEPTR